MVRLIPYSGSESPGPPPRWRREEFSMEIVIQHQRRGYTIREIAEATGFTPAWIGAVITAWLYRN